MESGIDAKGYETYKILQMIPAPSELYAQKISEDDYYDDEKAFFWIEKVVCLALIEYANKETEIKPMTLDENGDISLFVGERGSDRLIFKGKEEWLNDPNTEEHQAQAIRRKQ